MCLRETRAGRWSETHSWRTIPAPGCCGRRSRPPGWAEFSRAAPGCCAPASLPRTKPPNLRCPRYPGTLRLVRDKDSPPAPGPVLGRRKEPLPAAAGPHASPAVPAAEERDLTPPGEPRTARSSVVSDAKGCGEPKCGQHGGERPRPKVLPPPGRPCPRTCASSRPRPRASAPTSLACCCGAGGTVGGRLPAELPDSPGVPTPAPALINQVLLSGSVACPVPERVRGGWDEASGIREH